ncbi:MAG: urease accessory protein [Candidatus Tokpelaia sp. JSC189]|nr:MAG: urease accessory protein [Candidatus Tokpelaia sp. JSC189]
MENEGIKSSAIMQRMFGKAAASFCHRSGQTVLHKLYQEGAARLHFPHNDKGCFEGVMINTAGGMTGGDHMIWDIRLGRETTAMFTTQAAEKVYRALGDIPAKVDVCLSIDEKSRLYWLPQETILFNRSALQRRMEVELADHAEFLLCETVIFGRRLMGESLEQAFFRDNWIVRRNDEIIHAEALWFGPNIAEDLIMPVFLNGSGVIASLLLIAPDAGRFTEKACAIIGYLGGVSSWNGKLLARMIDKDFYSLRKRLISLIGLLNNRIGVPKVWSI